jgi:diaminopimelate decarboxylase
VRAAAAQGLGADAVSEHELRAAMEEGIAPQRIVCNGNAKSDRYLEAATSSGSWLAVDGLEELSAADSIGRSRGRPVPVLLRVSGLDVSGYTSAAQTTADRWSKFGFPAAELPVLLDAIRRRRGVCFVGFSAHIGTQLCDPNAFLPLLFALRRLSRHAAARGIPPRVLDLGGGWPVRFMTADAWHRFTDRLRAQVEGRLSAASWVTWNGHPMGFAQSARDVPSGEPAVRWRGKAYWTAYPGAEMLAHVMRQPLTDGVSFLEAIEMMGAPQLIIEPGRSLMATAGVTLAEARTTKRVQGHEVVSLDLGINNHGTYLLAPDIFPVAVLPRRQGEASSAAAFLAGRLCFGGDLLSIAKVPLNRLPRRGDRVAIYGTGAYSADHFASHSCGYPLPAKVALTPDGDCQLWRAPGTYADVFPPLGRPGPTVAAADG